MRRSISLFLAATLSPLALMAAPASAQMSAPAGPGPVAAAPSQNQATRDLHKLFEDSDEGSLRRNPLFAIFRGDTRFADRFGDFITDAYYAAEKRANASDMARLKKIDRAQLSPTDQIAYDVFKWQTEQAAISFRPDILKLNSVRPLNHFFGFHTFYPTFSSGKGGAPFATVQDYDNALKRHREFIIFLDRAVGRFREGAKSGVVETKMTINNVIGQLDAQLAQKTEESPYFAPVLNFPANFSPEDKARFSADYRATIEQGIYPAYRRLRDYLKTDYLPVARDGAGLKYMKGGDKLYVPVENIEVLSRYGSEETDAQLDRLGVGAQFGRAELFKETVPCGLTHAAHMLDRPAGAIGALRELAGEVVRAAEEIREGDLLLADLVEVRRRDASAGRAARFLRQHVHAVILPREVQEPVRYIRQERALVDQQAREDRVSFPFERPGLPPDLARIGHHAAANTKVGGVAHDHARG